MFYFPKLQYPYTMYTQTKMMKHFDQQSHYFTWTTLDTDDFFVCANFHRL